MTLLGFVGDVLVDRDEPQTAFDAVAELLAEPAAVFANCEAPFTTDPHLAPTTGIPLTPHPRNTEAFRHFDVMALANNHIVDAGHAAMLETAEHVRRAGALPIGVGPDLAAARAPAVLERDGLRIAYLAYASVFPSGYEARVDWPGLAPVRAYNHHVDRLPNYWEPGVLGRVVSVPVEEDYDGLADDLAAARAACDVVVASFHWGDFEAPYVLTDHERRTARFAIDHGADVVVGHHHHIVRGIEWYRGKPVFYGLGHFVFDLRDPPWPAWYTAAQAPGGEADTYELYDRPGWPLLPMHPDARMTMVAYVRVGPDASLAAGFLPCTIAPDGRVHPHDARSAEGLRVTDYVRRCCETQGLETTLAVSTDDALAGLATVQCASR
jgi:poly-gamma-glutamate synthesis protein (capsule biosynthesis protein)